MLYKMYLWVWTNQTKGAFYFFLAAELYTPVTPLIPVQPAHSFDGGFPLTPRIFIMIRNPIYSTFKMCVVKVINSEHFP